MKALSELFDDTTLVVPCSWLKNTIGEIPLTGHNLSVSPVSTPSGRGFRRKIDMPIWVLRNAVVMIREFQRADAVHTPIPGDIGTIGMLMAFVFRKPLFVRYCGNWYLTNSTTKRFLKWFIRRYAGGRNVMMATGGDSTMPSSRNPNVSWIFATSLTEKELNAAKKIRKQPPKEKIRLVIVGRQEIGKGTEVLIESLPLIMNDFQQVNLDVVGDGMALPAFQKKASTLGLDDRVTFHGKVDHTSVMRLLNQADLFCFPTSTEGFPKAVLEALACGLPVVTTRVSVLPSLIGRGCGMLIDEITPEAIAKAVHKILSDPNRYSAMSAQAIETAKEYSLERWRDTIGTHLYAAWGRF